MSGGLYRGGATGIGDSLAVLTTLFAGCSLCRYFHCSFNIVKSFKLSVANPQIIRT